MDQQPSNVPIMLEEQEPIDIVIERSYNGKPETIILVKSKSDGLWVATSVLWRKLGPGENIPTIGMAMPITDGFANALSIERVATKKDAADETRDELLDVMRRYVALLENKLGGYAP